MKLSFSIKARPKNTPKHPKHKPVPTTEQRTRLVSMSASGVMKTDKAPAPEHKEFIIPCLHRLEPKQGKHTILNAPIEATTINPGARPSSSTSPIELEGADSEDAQANSGTLQ
ncbi:hypothetical protein Pmar_PMAR011442 [Perkinsus marinus ATCC 50983]|uniref:Uncharacterized protein n=1 Tax=Perkinsus marinus (strain ATCC 50983 / TXsc) TaxID=423536 RepID=C5LMZ7_PERM5|nr:hypothetical protein Pmar_PMAR011442 [Perkinsus marinus ATCC 50983]EER01894.1 hypothetical protein Pmar_PMAR011442 [Perkinsus marinus ATCC 50983]|eukprot:XP_002769176.1 hypothetical protein Pmar_PMAR011442 [Perkinsus marinus ATCC 50983]